jgi:HEAT repeat protein
MWVKGAAIRPVPRHAVLGAEALKQIERELGDDSAEASETLDAAFARFESTQPHLADAMAAVLSKPLGETALALGYFLTIATWLAFERTFGGPRLREVSGDAVRATRDAIVLEEELRALRGGSGFDLDELVSTEQPHLLAFVHDHVEAALSPRSATFFSSTTQEAAAEEVRIVYRAVVLLALCLSHAVLPLDGAPRGTRELMA